MKMKRELLRAAARSALKARGYEVELVPGPGIIPGARLKAAKNGTVITVAVRTSLDREVGLVRNQNLTWRTVSRVDRVLIAVPSADDPQSVEVLAFEPDVLITVFSAALAAVEKRKQKKYSYKDPIFVALDDVKNSRTGEVRPGLKARAAWQTELPLSHPELRGVTSAAQDPRTSFIERLKQEVAEFIGVDVSKVVLEIRIVA